MVLEGCYAGFHLYQKNGKTWSYLRHLDGFDESCRVFEQDKKGRIWVAHGYKGIYRLELDADLKKVVAVRFYGDKKGFPSNLGINVFKIDGELVFTSEHGGLYTYNEKQDRFVLNTTFEAYLGSMPKVSKLCEQENGNIWVSEIGRTGILVKQSNGAYSYETQPFYKLKNDLIKGFELFGEMPNSSVLFGFGSGFIQYNPSTQKNFNERYFTMVRKVELISSADSLVFGGEADSVSRKISPIVLDYKNNSVRFIFSAAYFEDIESTRYTYFLEGFDKTWSDYTSKTEREYTNLPEGSYTFHVKAMNIYHVESIEGRFMFKVRPPWIRTWWARLIYLVIGLWVFYFAAKLYSRKREIKIRRDNLIKEREIIHLRNQQLSKELEDKTKELGDLATLLVNKNSLLLQIKEYFISLTPKLLVKDQREVKAISQKIDLEADVDNDWKFIAPLFDSVHLGFLSKLKEKYPELKPHDLNLCAYIRMNLSSKEIAVLMNNTPHGIEAHRYRLRKTLGFDRGTNLKDFLSSL